VYDPEPLRVLLIGGRSFAAAVRDLLVQRAGVAVVGVAAPAGDPIATMTADLGPALVPAGTDLIVAAQNHRFIPPAMLAATRLGGLSYHPSLLPLHRGRDAVYWTIRDRDRVTGGTVYWLNDVVDGGPIAAQEWCFVRPDDTPSTLWRRELFPLGLRLIDRVVGDLVAGRAQRHPQDESLATWEPCITRPMLAAGGSP
jgi:methionyl-tRNA formyltransferase